MDCLRKQTIGWCLGNLDAKTFRKFFERIDVSQETIYYTDDWDVYSKVIPNNRHIIGKCHTIAIEHNNSNVRHYLGRMIRRTKVVSKSLEMIDLSLPIHWYLNEAGGFGKIIKPYNLSFD